MAEYEHDNLSPNDGEVFFTPFPTKKKNPTKQYISGKKLVKDAIASLEADMAFLSDVDSIEADPRLAPDVHLRIVFGNKVAKAAIKTTKERLEALLES